MRVIGIAVIFFLFFFFLLRQNRLNKSENAVIPRCSNGKQDGNKLLKIMRKNERVNFLPVVNETLFFSLENNIFFLTRKK